MATITPNKTVDIAAHISWQTIATANVVVGSAIDVSAKRRVRFFCKLARNTGTAFTAGWPNVRIEASWKSTGEDGGDWIPLASYQMALGASLVNTTLNGAVTAGAGATFVVTSASNIAAGDLIFLGDSTASNWEIVRVKSVSGTTITAEETIANAHANAATVNDQSELWAPSFNVEDFDRIRAVVDNAGGGQTMAVEIGYTTYDSDDAT